ncbi:hypothetical protein B0T16DRAFT_423124 [Cercophora newfieldiana]|uniref:Uncharacterized protein n=1 Tax=Cercophora newfieldiana TaxID=92897 RepID=A0AA39XSN0_9PEZI|nr:hypothetical protein B0T16DRAFT_423124 [Cercophora newfieldiana]
MRRPSRAASLLALLIPAAFAEVIIVSCIGDAATRKAKDLITNTGGEIIYEYRLVGPQLAAAVSSLALAEIESHPLFNTECSFFLDKMIPPPKPVQT